jgi:hypothetical protein
MRGLDPRIHVSARPSGCRTGHSKPLLGDEDTALHDDACAGRARARAHLGTRDAEEYGYAASAALRTNQS